MKHGAYHYITKDSTTTSSCARCAERPRASDLNRQVITLSAQVAEQSEREFIIGPSRQIRDIVDLVQRVAKLGDVLILGESGTGKERCGAAAAQRSRGGDAPFIAVNMSAIPHELVESTLFGHERGAFTGAVKQQLGKFELRRRHPVLDETATCASISRLLLRAIQAGDRTGRRHPPIKTDFRLIAATNIDPSAREGKRRFREDPTTDQRDPIRRRRCAIASRICLELARLFLDRYKSKFRSRSRGSPTRP